MVYLRNVLRLVVVCFICLAVIAFTSFTRLARAAQGSPGIPPNNPRISYQFDPVATGLNRPLSVTQAGDDRLFIVEQSGAIRIWRNGALLSTPFINVSSLIPPIPVNGYTEQGLLGLSFEPNYASTGRFYIYYTDSSGNPVIARYHVSSNPDVADPTSAKILITIPHPTYTNHNGGWLTFGPDQFLYIGVGDGGSAGDPWCAAENPADVRGKILRIGVVGQDTYTSPAANTFTPGQAPEVYAFGLRNPWRNSFDRSTGDLYIADVGQNAWEEVNYVPSGQAAGVNYGWSQFEATHPYDRASVRGSACQTSSVPPTAPILEYDHLSGDCAVTGGYVYRGQAYAWLDGVYFYADWCSGRLWAAWRSVSGVRSSTLLLQTSYQVSSFGEDRNGELYVVDLTGGVYHLTSALSPLYLPVISRI